MADNNNNSTMLENQNSSGTPTVFAKPFPDVSKIEVFSGQNFRRWQERVSTLLDMYGVVMTLSTSKPDESSAKQVEDWTYANKVCHTPYLAPCLMICLMCISHIRKRKKFGIR